MKKSIYILLLIISSGLFAQNSDEKLFNALKQKFDLTKFDTPSETIYFNKDTVIIVGSFADLSNPIPRYKQKQNVVYKTNDGGKNWKAIEINGNLTVYDAYHKNNGKIWIGGSNNFIYFSPDFGETWIRKIKPFKPVDRILSIFMVNENFGIAGGLANGLAITYDNWKTSKQIETPLDQKKFQILKNSARSRINKIAIVDTIILINQNEHIYYSGIDNINWKKFNIPVSDFIIDENKKEIHLYSANDKVFVLSKNLELVKKYKDSFFFYRKPIKDSIYLNTDDFLKKGIKSIKITSTKWLVDKQQCMVTLYKPKYEVAKYYHKKDYFKFKSKGYKRKKIKIDDSLLFSTFNNKAVNTYVDEILQKISFDEMDYNDYLQYLYELKIKRKKEKSWGGDFTSEINLNNPHFKNYKKSLQTIKQSYIDEIFKELYLPNFDEKEFLTMENHSNEILIEIKNSDNKILKISNKNSKVFSIPWEIELNGVKIKSYNPVITKFVRNILPKDFDNYKILLGGEFIYKLIKEKIVDEIEYKNTATNILYSQ